MSEQRPAGYESLSPTRQEFVDYVSSHARQGNYAGHEVEQPGGGEPSRGGRYTYDVDTSDHPSVIPFDQIVFEDWEYGDTGDRKQKDQASFYMGGVHLATVYHELGPHKDGSYSGGFRLWGDGKGSSPLEDPSVAPMLQQLGELEQAGKMAPSADPYQVPQPAQPN